jgi:hypothetical protein
MKEQIAMIQIGQKIDDFIDDLEFDAYQNNEIKKIKFSDYEGKWLVHPRQQHLQQRGRNSPASFRPRVLCASIKAKSGRRVGNRAKKRSSRGRLGGENLTQRENAMKWNKIMNDGYSGRKWEVTLSPEALIHVHYETASPEVINDGFKGLARELREVADQIEAIAPQIRQQT